MRTAKLFFAVLPLVLSAFTIQLRAAGVDSVAVQYHFAGVDSLARGTNFHVANEIFRYTASARFESLVLNRLSHIFWKRFGFDPAGDPGPTVVPLLDDLLYVESVASFDATADNFVLAAHLEPKRARAWRERLETAMRSKGGEIAGFSGERWNNGFWMIEIRDWVVVGRGDQLPDVRRDYLQQIQKTSAPGPALKNGQWLEAMIDWPRLSADNLPHLLPLKPARTTINVSATKGRFHITADLSYPSAAHWTSRPWRIPKELVREPLISFTAAQDVEPYMQLSSLFSKLPNDPFTNQFFCWSRREMPFQTYMTWPVEDGPKVMKELGVEGVPNFNLFLQNWNHSQLKWLPGPLKITWQQSTLMGPFIRPVSEKEGNYLLAGLFPLDEAQSPAPGPLWRQFEGRNDLVYYNWELTALRVHQWRLYSQMLPQMMPVSRAPDADVDIVENWLAGLEVALGNTVTEVTRVSPQRLTVTRSAPFVFTGLELVWLSHWLAGEPAGPLNMNLLPKAKISGPGIPSR